jgi:L-ascorbate metabolism protein UlaG (beta-lactamase superfamily)
VNIRLIRNATLRLEYAGRQILIDPDLAPQHARASFTGKSPNPMVPLPCSLEEILNGVELLLVSHLHQDHFDAVATEAIPKNLPLLCQPADEAKLKAKGFGQAKGVQESLEWNGIRITRTAGEHGSGAVLDLMGQVSGFVLQAEGEPTLYWAGDTILYPAVRETIARFSPQVIVTHSCGAVWADMGLIVMDAAQTLEVCRLAPNAQVVAAHMEALDHATVSRTDLRLVAQAAGIVAPRLQIPADGEELRF